MKHILIFVLILIPLAPLMGQWERMPFPLSANIVGVDFIDSSTGWVVTSAVNSPAKILKTTDGGYSWIEQYSGDFIPTRIQAFRSSVQDYYGVTTKSTFLFVSDDNGALIKSVDGGNHWQRIPVTPGRCQFYFLNENIGWYRNVWVNPMIVEKTVDGGATWDTTYECGNQRYADIVDFQFIDELNGWAVGYHAVLYTHDGGITWSEPVAREGFYPLYTVWFISPSVGYAAGGLEITYKTTDGGLNWNREPVSTDLYPGGPYGPWNGQGYHMQRMKGVNENDVWSIGDGSVVLRKAGEGQTWSIVPTKFQYPYTLGTTLRDLKIINGNHIWAVGDSGTILKYVPEITVTLTDPVGGDRWYPRLSYPITWIGNNLLVEKIRLEYSIDHGTSWNVIVDSLDAHLGTYNWTVPETPSTQCRIRIVGISHAFSGLSDSTFEIVNDPRRITLLSPVAGQTIHTDSTLTIKWNLNYTASGLAKIQFLYNRTFPITDSVLVDINKGEYIWRTPSTPRSLQIIISDNQNNFITDRSAEIQIYFPPALFLIRPDEGRRVQADSLYRVSFSGRYVQKAKVELSTDAGRTWAQIWDIIDCDSTPDFTREFDWRVPHIISKECLIRVTDISDSTVSSMNQKAFEITDAVPLGYFPMQIGNRWYYQLSDINGPTGGYSMLMMTGDTIHVNGYAMYGFDQYVLQNNQFVLNQQGARHYRQDGKYIYSPDRWDDPLKRLIDFSDPAATTSLFSREVKIYSHGVSVVPIFYSYEFADSIGFTKYSYSVARFPFVQDASTLVGCVLGGASLGNTFDGIPVLQRKSDGTSMPDNHVVLESYPNPFNPSTTLSFSVPSRCFVTLKIFDVVGREIATVVSEELSAGKYSRRWDATSMPNGVYFCRFNARPVDGADKNTYAETKKILLVK